MLLVVDTVHPLCCGGLKARAIFNFIFAYMAEVEGTTEYWSIQKTEEREREKECVNSEISQWEFFDWRMFPVRALSHHKATVQLQRNFFPCKEVCCQCQSVRDGTLCEGVDTYRRPFSCPRKSGPILNLRAPATPEIIPSMQSLRSGFTLMPRGAN